MGREYVSQIFYKFNAGLREEKIEGLQGFGTLGIKVISGLIPDAEFAIRIRQYCAHNSNLASGFIGGKFQLLPKGRS